MYMGIFNFEKLPRLNLDKEKYLPEGHALFPLQIPGQAGVPSKIPNEM